MENNKAGTFLDRPTPLSSRSPFGFSLNRFITLGVFVVIFAFFSIFANNFFTTRNMLNLLIQTSTFAILSIGSTMELVVGGIDYSLGAVIGLSSAGLYVFTMMGMPLWLAMILAVGLGGMVGAANGFLVARLRLPSFIATFAMAMLIYGSLSFAVGLLLASSSAGAPPPTEQPGLAHIGDLANTAIFPIYSIAADGTRIEIFPGLSWITIIMVLVAVFFHLVLTKTRLGRHLFLVGSNEVASRLSGIKVVRVKLTAFVIGGLLAGLTGVLLTSRMGGPPGGAAGYETVGIICAMLGGASFFGGAGSVVGTVIGAFILSTLSMGLTMMNPDKSFLLPHYIDGLVVLVAVFLDQKWNRK
jgi:ribose transport system permease protein